MPLTIYGDSISGNCLKVKWVADFLGLSYDWIETDILKGQSRTPEFLGMNPAGQVPAVILDDGRPLAQSNAIITYLAEGSALIPADAYDRARMLQWMFWEQYSHEPYIAVCRFHMLYQKKPKDAREAWRVERGENALSLMERKLTGKSYLVGDSISIADISLLGYTRVAHEGGFDLSDRPAIRAWIGRCERDLGIA